MIFDSFDIKKVAELTGRPDDQMRLLFILLLAYPLGYLLRYIRGKWVRHIYSIVIGVVLQVFMFKEGVLHFWGLGLVVYSIITFVDRKKQPWIVFVVCLAHLSFMHIYRMLFDYGNWSLDETTFLMPLISRLSSLGFVYADGAKDDKLLTKDQIERKVTTKPTIIEILSYISFP